MLKHIGEPGDTYTGIGFCEHDDAFDFKNCLYTFKRGSVAHEDECDGNLQNSGMAEKDFSLKEGQTTL